MKIVNLRDCPEYINTIAKWHYSEWKDLNPNQSFTQRVSEMQEYLNKSFIPSTYVAINEVILGSVAIIRSDMDTKLDFSPWLASVYVRKEARNNGIATKLIEHAINESKKNGITELYLFTPSKEEFYKKLHWEVLSREIYRNHDVTVMKHTIT